MLKVVVVVVRDHMPQTFSFYCVTGIEKVSDTQHIYIAGNIISQRRYTPYVSYSVPFCLVTNMPLAVYCIVKSP